MRDKGLKELGGAKALGVAAPTGFRELNGHAVGDRMTNIRCWLRKLEARVSTSRIATGCSRADESVFGKSELEIHFRPSAQAVARAQEATSFGERENRADRAAVRADASR